MLLNGLQDWLFTGTTTTKKQIFEKPEELSPNHLSLFLNGISSSRRSGVTSLGKNWFDDTRIFQLNFLPTHIQAFADQFKIKKLSFMLNVPKKRGKSPRKSIDQIMTSIKVFVSKLIELIIPKAVTCFLVSRTHEKKLLFFFLLTAF